MHASFNQMFSRSLGPAVIFSRAQHQAGAEMRPAILCGIVTGDVPVNAPVGYWPIFSQFLATVPEFFAEVNPTQFPF